MRTAHNNQIIIGAVVLLYLALTVVALVWLFKDAKKKGINPTLWIVLAITVGGGIPIVIVYYFVTKDVSALEQCSRCGERIPKGAEFCPKCGNKSSRIVKCPACGYPISGESFCPKCGARLI